MPESRGVLDVTFVSTSSGRNFVLRRIEGQKTAFSMHSTELRKFGERLLIDELHKIALLIKRELFLFQKSSSKDQRRKKQEFLAFSSSTSLMCNWPDVLFKYFP